MACLDSNGPSAARRDRSRGASRTGRPGHRLQPCPSTDLFVHQLEKGDLDRMGAGGESPRLDLFVHPGENSPRDRHGNAGSSSRQLPCLLPLVSFTRFGDSYDRGRGSTLPPARLIEPPRSFARALTRAGLGPAMSTGGDMVTRSDQKPAERTDLHRAGTGRGRTFSDALAFGPGGDLTSTRTSSSSSCRLSRAKGPGSSKFNVTMIEISFLPNLSSPSWAESKIRGQSAAD